MKANIWAKILAVATGWLSLSAPGFLAAQSPAPRYAFKDLGTLGGTNTAANAINNLGQIVGQSDVIGAVTQPHAFLYSNGVMKDLGTLGSNAIAPSSSAQAINDAGQIAGYSTASNSAQHVHAFLYSGGVMTDLTPGTNDSKAYGINNLGKVVGETQIPDFQQFGNPNRAFVYSNGTLTTLSAPTGKGSVAYGINDSSQTVGNYTTNFDFMVTNDFGTNTAFLYDNGVTNNLSAVGGLGTLRAYTAVAINNQEQVTGYAVNSSNTIRHAYLYSGGGMTDLGTLDSVRTNTEGLALNNLGQVVGTAATNLIFDGDYPTNTSHAFLYSGGTMMDLNNLTTAPFTLESATGINDYGQIVGYGVSAARIQRAFLLTPMPTLAITTAGSSVTIAWATNGLNFALLANSSASGTNWTALTNAPVVVNGTNQVTISATNESEFFQLMLTQ